MTEVAFHFNAPDKVAYACRLLRKALTGSAQVVVAGLPDALDLLDKALWAAAPHEFLPHCRSDSAPELLAASPVVLARPDAQAFPHQEVLLNLSDTVPAGFGRFERLIEVVSRDDDSDRQSARARWKHYTDRGYAIVRHDLTLKS